MQETGTLKVKMCAAISVAGTFRVGHLPESVRYAEIVKALGEPVYRDDMDEETKVEWTGKINGKTFTIYDRNTGKGVEENTQWSIGGGEIVIADMVIRYLRESKEREELSNKVVMN